jgi:hypothetical protein
MGTRFTRLVGCAVRLQQAGTGGATTADLVVAVAVSARTAGAFGANFLMPILAAGIG